MHENACECSIYILQLYLCSNTNPLNNTSNSIHFMIVTFYIILWGFNNFDQYFISDNISLTTCSHARIDIGKCCGIKNYWILNKTVYFMILLSILLRSFLSASYFEIYHEDHVVFVFFKHYNVNMTNLKHAADCLLQWKCMSVQYVTYNGFVVGNIYIILSIFF